MSLRDLPEGTISREHLRFIAEGLVDEIRMYASNRITDVQRGAETPELAALLVEKYGYGVAKAADIVGIDAEIIKEVDRLIVQIDPDVLANRKARWDARPALLAFNKEC